MKVKYTFHPANGEKIESIWTVSVKKIEYAVVTIRWEACNQNR